jgi:hypothetical protein
MNNRLIGLMFEADDEDLWILALEGQVLCC